MSKSRVSKTTVLGHVEASHLGQQSFASWQVVLFGSPCDIRRVLAVCEVVSRSAPQQWGNSTTRQWFEYRLELLLAKFTCISIDIHIRKLAVKTRLQAANLVD